MKTRGLILMICFLLIPLLGIGIPGVAQTTQYIDYPMDVRYDVGITMRDGVRLSADLYLPEQSGSYPTVLLVTPYNNNGNHTLEEAWSWVVRSYVYATVDARGRYDSDGDFDAWRTSTVDGSDLISWIAEQSWSNGKVATIGTSYSGMNQWLTAKADKLHHVAIMANGAPADAYFDLMRWNGVPKLDMMYTWLMGMYGRVNQSRAGWNWSAVMWNLPLNTLDRVAGRTEPTWRDWMEHSTFGDYWQPMQVTGYHDQFDIPSFNVTGWSDGQVQGVTKLYSDAVRTGRPEDHMLIIGPWVHGATRPSATTVRDYGPRENNINVDSLRYVWLNAVMNDEMSVDLPNVLYFLPVKNRWQQAAGWPLPGTNFTNLYLDSDGNANTLFGDGELRWRRPRESTPDEFTYYPANPVPTISNRTGGARGGIARGPVDNRAVETREDVLVYTTEPLEKGMEITGPVNATIYISTDVPDTDITVKLLDIYPDGRALNLSHGIARLRYHESFSDPEPLEPGEVYAVNVEMYPMSNFFKAGHRIRIEVSSSNFPTFGRNLNTGCSDTCTEMRPAHTKVYHSPEYPSQIRIPVVPDSSSRPIAVTNSRSPSLAPQN